MKQFISCDWGTSAFRLRLADAITKKILAETKSTQGIAATNGLFIEQTATDRLSFYCDFILQQIELLEKEHGSSLDDVPVVISGMASSTIGMMELPYRYIPLKTNIAGLETHVIPATEKFRHQMILVSGVRSLNDVMRGEETLLAGCAIDDNIEKQLFILPGTHSKHVIVEEAIVKDFKTYMTGELFNLISSKSILTDSVQEDYASPKNNEPFVKGIYEAMATNFLNSIFHVRTNILFEKLSKKENYHYLSGLLIGEEVKNIRNENYVSVAIVSTGILLQLYTEALSAIGFKDKLIQINADAALIDGHVLILNHYQ